MNETRAQKKGVLGCHFDRFLSYFLCILASKCLQNPSPKGIDFLVKKREAKKHPKSEFRGAFRSLALQTSAPRPPLGGRGVKTYITNILIL